jgi:hypothetical protein
MKTPLLCSTLLAALVCMSGAAQASLVGRDINGAAVTARNGSGVLDSSAVFLYDTVLNVTWLRLARGSGQGSVTWAQANTWAAGLNVGGYTGWRLPTMIDTGTAGCNFAYIGTDCGYSVQTKSGNLAQHQVGQTVYSEMASLWYDTLGNKPIYDATGAGPQSSWKAELFNDGDFDNLQSLGYWSGLQYAPSSSSDAWYFNTYLGDQNHTGKTDTLYALAVRPGDVLVVPSGTPSAVPIPAAAWLMASGLGALDVAARKRRAKAA